MEAEVQRVFLARDINLGIISTEMVIKGRRWEDQVGSDSRRKRFQH